MKERATYPDGGALAGAGHNVTVDEALTLARRCQQYGQLTEAEALYRKVLELQPERPEALHYFGVLAHQLGRSDDAVALIARSLALVPNRPDWHSNLGRIFQETGRLTEAMAAYRRALDFDPTHANTQNNLGVLQKALGLAAEAENAYRTAIRLDPDHADAYHNLAILLGATGRTPEAVVCYCKALTLRPHHAEARRQLVLAYCVTGQRDKALGLCEEWLNAEPDDALARHTLAAVSGRDVPARASDAYVQRIFDAFASTFEAKLAQLHYRAPALVGAALANSDLPQVRSLDVVDVGCGTGLCGPLLAPYASRLSGVDLSGGMLTHARDKQVYDELVQDELTSYLRTRPDAFDLIVSADALVYFGPLDAVAAAAATALRRGGRFIFTVEESTDAGIESWSLAPHGRFNHSARYVEQLLVEAGLIATIVRAELRMESGLPVRGLVVTAAKPELLKAVLSNEF